MTQILRVGILGGGQIVRNVHLPTLATMSNVATVALSEPDAVACNEIGAKYPALELCGDWREVIARDNVDAVLVALPNALHAPAALAAFERNKHVYLEKPLGLDLFEAQEVLSAWRESCCVGAIGFNYRFNPLWARLKELFGSGVTGDVISIRTTFCTPLRKLPPWKRERKSGGGVLLDLASHHIDLVRWLTDANVVEVSARLRSVQTEDDNAWLEMRLDNGILVQSFFSLTAVDEDRIEIFGTCGKLACERYTALSPQWIPSAGLGRGGRLRQSAGQILNPQQGARHVMQKLRSCGNEPSYRASLEAFVSAVGSGTQMSPDLQEGYASLRVVLAAEQAHQRGVRLDLSNDL